MFAIVRWLSFQIHKNIHSHSTQNECHSVCTYKRWIYFLLRFYAIIFLFERFFFCRRCYFFAYGNVRKSFLVYHTLRVHLRFAFSQTIKFFLFLSFFARCVLLMLTFYFYAKSLCSNRMVESCDKGEKEKKIIKMICKTMKWYLKCKISFFLVLLFLHM